MHVVVPEGRPRQSEEEKLGMDAPAVARVWALWAWSGQLHTEFGAQEDVWAKAAAYM